MRRIGIVLAMVLVLFGGANPTAVLAQPSRSAPAAVVVPEKPASGHVVKPLDWQGDHTGSFMSWNYPTLAFSGNTVGWPRGNITLVGYLYAPNGAQTRYENYCENSTYCNLASVQICPAIPGVWKFLVSAYTPFGSDDAEKSVLVTL